MAYVHPPPSPLALGTHAAFARNARSSRVAGILLVAAVHALFVVAIWHVAPAQRVLAHATPVIVRLLSPEPPAPHEHRTPPPPKVAPKMKPVDPRLRTIVPPIESTTPAPLPESPVETATQTPAPVSAADVSAPVQPVGAPAPATPPRFDADYLKNPAPTYPPIARRNGEQGRVLLRVLVASDGTAQDVVLKTSSGHERLDQAALDTVRQWRFVPARVGADAVAAWVVVPISFSLSR